MANQIHDQIAQRIQSFATELEGLIRRAAIDAVATSLGGGAARAATPARQAAPAPSRARPSAGGKRPPAELARVVTKAGEWIKANPGRGVEDMAKALALATKELALPIAKLLEAKTIKKRGVKRATKYYPN